MPIRGSGCKAEEGKSGRGGFCCCEEEEGRKDGGCLSSSRVTSGGGGGSTKGQGDHLLRLPSLSYIVSRSNRAMSEVDRHGPESGT